MSEVPQIGFNFKLDGKKLDAITETAFLGIYSNDYRFQIAVERTLELFSHRLSSAAYVVRR